MLKELEEMSKGQKLLIPKFKEQKKIGEFFKQLDNDITLHQ